MEVTYTERDYVRALEAVTQRQTRISYGIFALGALLLTLFLYRADPAGFHWWTIPAIGLLFLGLVLFAKKIQRMRIGKQLKSFPGIKDPHLYTFTDEGFSIAGRLSNTELKWEAVIKVRESESEFLFYTGKNFAQFLPKRVLTDEGKAIELRQLLERNLGTRAALLPSLEK